MLQIPLLLAICLFFMVEPKDEWQKVGEDKAIEYQWDRPANNSCEVRIRDLLHREQTTLSVELKYLPHRSAKQAVNVERAVLSIGSSGMVREHINECEEVTAVIVSIVGRN